MPVTNQRFELHPAQIAIWEADPKYRTLLAVAGEQGGKTILGALWIINKAKQWREKPANFIIGAPTYKVMEQSTKPTFKKIQSMSKFVKGDFYGKADSFQLESGGAIYFRTTTDPDSVIGIPDCVAGWIDEAGKCSRMFYLNVQGRVARLQGNVLCTSTPYALNWLNELIQKSESGERPDVLYQRWRSIDNPSYPKDEYDRLKAILPPRIFRMRVEGFHEKAEGMIHEAWDDTNWATPFLIPKEWPKYGGIDWGYDHPFALSIRTINPTGYCFGISFAKISGLSTMQQLDLIAQKTKTWGVKIWSCGHDRPEQIQALQERGIAAVKYFEYNPNYREVKAGDQKLSELIFRKRYRVFKDVECAKDLEEEYQTYVWDKDLDSDSVRRERPIDDGHGHDLMAAERYVTVLIESLGILKEKKEVIRPPLGSNIYTDNFKPKMRSKSKHWAAN